MRTKRRINEGSGLTKGEVSSMISSKIADSLKSQSFKKEVKSIVAASVEEFFKTLYQRTSIWKSSFTK